MSQSFLRALGALGALFVATQLAGCAQFSAEIADAQVAPVTQADARLPREGETKTEQAEDSAANPPDLLTQARAIAAAKGFGEAPGTQDAARQALMMAAAARGQTAAPAQIPAQPAATPANLADVNERIRLAALRLRAETQGTAQIIAPAMSAQNRAQERAYASAPERAPTDDPREIFRRAREMHLSARAPQPAAFGGLAAPDKMIVIAPPETAQSYFIEAVRRKEAARAGENLFTLAR
jgi:hypothetical protein